MFRSTGVSKKIEEKKELDYWLNLLITTGLLNTTPIFIISGTLLICLQYTSDFQSLTPDSWPLIFGFDSKLLTPNSNEAFLWESLMIQQVACLVTSCVLFRGIFLIFLWPLVACFVTSSCPTRSWMVWWSGQTTWTQLQGTSSGKTSHQSLFELHWSNSQLSWSASSSWT